MGSIHEPSCDDEDEFLHRYPYSLPIDPKQSDLHGQYFSQFMPRIHAQGQVSDDATIQCQIDLFGKNRIGMGNGNLNMRCGGWVSLCMPYCLPERLSLVSYAFEAAYMHDDADEKTLKASEDDVHTETTTVDATDSRSENIIDPRRDAQVFSKVIVKLLEIDPEQAHDLIRGWELWKNGEKILRSRTSQHENLDQYLTERLADIGIDLDMMLARFSMGIVLTDEEQTMIYPVILPAYHLLILTNDYFSFGKEYDQYLNSPIPGLLFNSVWLYMQWYKLLESDAKSAIKKIIISLEGKYCALKEAFLRNIDGVFSSPIRDWFRGLDQVIAGNLLWSITCPRYNPSIGNHYMGYLKERTQEGVWFSDDSTQCEDFLGRTNEKLDWNMRREKMLGSVNQAG